MEEIAIRVDDASVCFNTASFKVDSIKEYLIRLVKKELRFNEYWAIKHVSLEVKRGEAWGIVGRNGAGKSTLLQVIAGILPPTTGVITVNGRIAPMIGMGAPLDSNMTASENIYYSGALLGLSRSFMAEKHDEIIAFAELGEYLDMPLKNYSSGMGARLGFSIATLVKPDILILDETLSAGGDAAFQKKCEQRVSDIYRNTTLLLVSHSGATVRKLCQKALWLNKGEVLMSGAVNEVCAAYEQSLR
jgi:ABC-type polysaccharide/polyol phosphate transport system ATPase subunit